MKIIDGMLLTEIGDSWVAVPTGDASDKLHGVVRLNKTGKFIWDALAEGLNEDEVVARLTAHYDVDDQTALESVRGVVGKLVEAELLEA